MLADFLPDRDLPVHFLNNVFLTSRSLILRRLIYLFLCGYFVYVCVLSRKTLPHLKSSRCCSAFLRAVWLGQLGFWSVLVGLCRWRVVLAEALSPSGWMSAYSGAVCPKDFSPLVCLLRCLGETSHGLLSVVLFGGVFCWLLQLSSHVPAAPEEAVVHSGRPPLLGSCVGRPRPWRFV